MIDFNKIRALADGAPVNTFEVQLPDPHEGLSDAAVELSIRQETAKVRKEERERAQAEIAEQQWRATMAKASAVDQDVQELYTSRTAKGIRVRGGAIMVQLSDIHFGCTVEGMEERANANTYGFDVARHRLAALAEHALFYGVAHAAPELVIALTGDIFDSKIGKERKDKMFNREATACQAYLHGRDLIIQFIEHLRQSEVFGSIRIVGISGNEARLYADRGHSHIMAADNWDALLNADLSTRYRGSDIDCEFGVNRYVAGVQGWKVLLLHGDQGIDSRLSQTKVQSLLGTHDADFGISGHIHDTMVTGKWIRSASLVGTDFYAGDGLGLEGRACQNIFWLAEGQRNTYCVDLQDPDPAVEPYELFDYAGAFGSVQL